MSFAIPLERDNEVAGSTYTILKLHFALSVVTAHKILTKSKKICQPFPLDLTSLLKHRYSYFPFESGISLVPHIMHKRFLIKYDLPWSILLLKGLTLLFSQALIKHQDIMKIKYPSFSISLELSHHSFIVFWFGLMVWVVFKQLKLVKS